MIRVVVLGVALAALAFAASSYRRSAAALVSSRATLAAAESRLAAQNKALRLLQKEADDLAESERALGKRSLALLEKVHSMTARWDRIRPLVEERTDLSERLARLLRRARALSLP